MEFREITEKASELLQVLAIWGVSRQAASRIGVALNRMASNMTDADYASLTGGARLKPVTAEDAAEREAGPDATRSE